MDKEFQNSCGEVLEILKKISIEDYKKIPQEMIKSIISNANRDIDFRYNPNLTLEEQNVSSTAKTIIAILFRDYWATDEQRRKIIAYEKRKLLDT